MVEHAVLCGLGTKETDRHDFGRSGFADTGEQPVLCLSFAASWCFVPGCAGKVGASFASAQCDGRPFTHPNVGQTTGRIAVHSPGSGASQKATAATNDTGDVGDERRLTVGHERIPLWTR